MMSARLTWSDSPSGATPTRFEMVASDRFLTFAAMLQRHNPTCRIEHVTVSLGAASTTLNPPPGEHTGDQQ